MMRLVLSLAAAALLLIATAHAVAPPVLCLSNVGIIDGNGDSVVIPSQSIVVSAFGTIVDIFSTGSKPLPSNCRQVLDLTGHYLSPGLIDSHIHTSSEWPQDEKHMKEILDWTLRGGLTTLRDMGGDVLFIAPFADAALVPEVASPRIFYTTLMGGEEFILDPRVVQASHNFTPGATPWLRTLNQDTEIPMAARSARLINSRAVKIYADASAELLTAMSHEAHRQGLRVYSHSTVFPAKPSDALRAGVDVLSHAAYLCFEPSDPMPDSYKARFSCDYAHTPFNSANLTRLLQQWKQQDAILDATLWVFTHDETFSHIGIDWQYNITRAAHEMGIRVAAGTDELGDPKTKELVPNLHEEMELLVRHCGMSPAQAIRAATRTGAEVLGIERDFGTVAVGKVADFAIYSANPLLDIRNSRRVAYVVKEGVLFKGSNP